MHVSFTMETPDIPDEIRSSNYVFICNEMYNYMPTNEVVTVNTKSPLYYETILKRIANKVTLSSNSHISCTK